MIRPDFGHDVPPHRARRMLAALIGGASPEEIGDEENVATGAVERALTDALARRWTAAPRDFAKIQIARLETYCLALMDRVAAGELAAIDRALKILDRLDRYHGFRIAQPAPDLWGDEQRERLLAKINAVAANLADDEA